MTAEIALLNRRALAFAADSAVTISDGYTAKIYNSAEKIFELSRVVPIGVMLYNDLEFVGAPLDVIVRSFRSSQDQAFSSCREACCKFIDYLKSFPRHEANEDDHLSTILYEDISEIIKEHKNRLPEYFIDRVKEAENKNIEAGNVNYVSLYRDLLIEIIDEHIDIHLRDPLPGYLESIDAGAVSLRYEAVIRKAMNKLVKSAQSAADDSLFKKVCELALASIRSNIFSDGLTGIVFGGYGKDEIFPSLFSIEIDGIFFGEVKIKNTNDIDIDRRGDKAKIIPFAQSDMAERFLFGIDIDTQEDILNFIRQTMGRTIAAIQDATGINLDSLDIGSDKYASDIGKFLERLKRRSRDEILDMVDFMPKQELAFTAEAFISLTSIKRKISTQQETVGGPIDVAVITKNEGFVWIKRKHYFDMDLNPSYRVRTTNAGG